MTKERIAELQAIGEMRDYTEEELREIQEGTSTLSEPIKDWCREEAIRRGFLMRETGRVSLRKGE